MIKYNLSIFALLLLLTITSKTIAATHFFKPENPENKQTPSDTVFLGVDVLAHYPGGFKEAFNFINENIQYPDSSFINKIYGKVIAKFIIRQSGKIDSIEVIKGVNDELNNEAIRLIKLFPNWIPAQINGREVSSYTTFPISFNIQKESSVFVSTKDSVSIKVPLINVPVILDNIQMPRFFNLLVINTNLIESGNFVKPYPKLIKDSLILKYGTDAEFGVMIINTIKTRDFNLVKINNSKFINNSDTVWTEPEIPAFFPGGTAKLNEFLSANILYPLIAQKCFIQGYVEASFIVNHLGKIESIYIKTPGHNLLNNEVNRVIKMMPDWLPAKNNNSEVSSLISIPFLFSISKKDGQKISFQDKSDRITYLVKQPIIKLDGEILPSTFNLSLVDDSNIDLIEFKNFSKELISSYGENAVNGLVNMTSVLNDYNVNTVALLDSTNSINQDQIFQVVEEMPEFPGGDNALFQFLNDNVKYPVIAQENRISGRVITCFIIDKTGSVKNIEVVRGVHPLLDAEAIRVMSLMPSWNPGKQKGEFVNVKYTLPVNFRMQ